MVFDADVYIGSILKGDLHGAIRYVKQCPEQISLYEQLISRFELAQDCTYDVDDGLQSILHAYQQYYRDAFYLRIGKALAADRLRDRLEDALGLAGTKATLSNLEQGPLPELFRSRGLHFLGGQTGGWYGPYIWRTTQTVTYDVELPDGTEPYTVKLLDGFLSRSWIDYLSFGAVGTGGWTDRDGTIHCVSAAWDFGSESFRVSLLKHEAQHARDLRLDPHMSSEELEYRAKLVELIYSRERNLLVPFAQEADSSDSCNGHAMAAHRIIRDFAALLGVEAALPAIPTEQIRSAARILFYKGVS